MMKDCVAAPDSGKTINISMSIYASVSQSPCLIKGVAAQFWRALNGLAGGLIHVTAKFESASVGSARADEEPDAVGFKFVHLWGL